MEKEELYNHLSEYYQELQIVHERQSQELKTQHFQENNRFLELCKKVGETIGYNEQLLTLTRPMQFIDNTRQANFGNSIIRQDAKNFIFDKEKENEEIMQKKLLQKISQMPNCRIRDDGRCEWRKMIDGVYHTVCIADPGAFLKKLTTYKKELRKISNKAKVVNSPGNHRLADLINEYYLRYKQNCKSTSYKTVINKYLNCLTDNIEHYNKGMIVDVLNGIKAHRMAAHAYILLKNTFAEAAETGTILKHNPIANLKKSDISSITAVKQEKGRWFTPKEQQLIYANKDKTNIGNEIEFFLLVGCRLGEAFNAVPDLDNNRIYLNRTKRDGTSGYVPLSATYCAKLKANWTTMFKYASTYYTKKFRELLIKLKIKRQAQEKPIHRLRHTFATNLYYLGAKDVKMRASLLGHRSTRVTDDIYTDFDPAITKNDIIDIYGDLYPTFD